jgi:hypothetical protein
VRGSGSYCEGRIVTPPLFIATKREAFHGRGANDIFGSRDLEDVVTLVDGRPTITAEVAAAGPAVHADITVEVPARLSTTRTTSRRDLDSCYLTPEARFGGASSKSAVRSPGAA